MRLTKLYIRFYKSFNFDYEMKAHPKATPKKWHQNDAGWFPHVAVDFEPDVTAIVGANESGKSHLLDAVKILITGSGIERRDFCRYSSLFSVETGLMRYPEFGGRFEVLNQEDIDGLMRLGLNLKIGDKPFFFRPGNQPAFLLSPDEKKQVELSPTQLADFESLLPTYFELNTDLALPDSIPIATLVRDPSSSPSWSRDVRADLLNVLANLKSAAEVTAQAPALYSKLSAASTDRAEEHSLGRQLLVEVAHIDPQAFTDLAEAMQSQREGQVNGLIEEMNQALARHLNFARWWAQDKDFQLRVSSREHELAFTIRDRTGTDYSFSERSKGLKYFLSYYVQLLAHRRSDHQTEVLLMDEPDAYLSSAGQQDLLRILENFASPESGARHDQVVYVTHSPFLLNKNAGHRIRVLDKGASEEGSRVVRDATRNHYEPLRSSLGAFVAETAFIGGANLFVEGLADQVLLAGLSTHLRSRGVPASSCLDLNHVTIVVAGSASSIPYLAYLARGRDEVKPPCVALLDGDEQGKLAAKKLLRCEANGRQVLDPRFVIVLDDWSAKGKELEMQDGIVVREIEDLIPTRLAVEAARTYARNFLRIGEDDILKLKDSGVKDRLGEYQGSHWKALSAAFEDAFDTHLEKVGFSKELVAFVSATSPDATRPPGVPALENNFGCLFVSLVDLLHRAEVDEIDQRRSNRTRRTVVGFLRDYQDGASKDRASVVLKEIESELGDTPGGDEVRALVAGMRRTYRLTIDANKPVENFGGFREELDRLRYQERLAHQGPRASAVQVDTANPTSRRRTIDKEPKG